MSRSPWSHEDVYVESLTLTQAQRDDISIIYSQWLKFQASNLTQVNEHKLVRLFTQNQCHFP